LSQTSTRLDLTEAAFKPMSFSDDTEADCLDQLRDDGDLLLSLVAEDDEIIGHVALSPAHLLGPGRWAGLGPISVRADRQKQGVGSAIVDAAMNWLKTEGYDGCVLIGNPAVYGPMQFVSGGITYRDLPGEIVQYRSISGLKPKGEVLFSVGLENT